MSALAVALCPDDFEAPAPAAVLNSNQRSGLNAAI
jgi:hypothetical protein